MIVAVLRTLAEPLRPGAMRLLAVGLKPRVRWVMQTLGATERGQSRHMQALKQAGRVGNRRAVRCVRHQLDRKALLDAALARDPVADEAAA